MDLGWDTVTRCDEETLIAGRFKVMGEVGIAAGEPSALGIDALRLDPRNPRLPSNMADATQLELACFIDAHYEPIRIAESIARRGYFPSEPLIVVSAGDGSFTVLEGNRRLVALQGLADESIRANFVDPAEWSAIADGANLPAHIPVIIVDDPKDAAAVVGYRHISGIEPWAPLPKARFIAGLLESEEENLSFADVADLVGETEQSVRSHYRNYALLREASTRFGLETDRVENRFGSFARALQSSGVRAFLSVPPPGQVQVGAEVLPDHGGELLEELWGWLYGTETGTDPVISDSREITRLGTVIASDEGVAVLRATRDLEMAFEAAGGPLARLLNRLAQARNALRAAHENIALFRRDPQVEELVDECREALEGFD